MACLSSQASGPSALRGQRVRARHPECHFARAGSGDPARRSCRSYEHAELRLPSALLDRLADRLVRAGRSFSGCSRSGMSLRSLARPRPRRCSGLKPSRSMKRPRLCHGRGGSVGWAGNHRRTIRRPPLLLSTGSTNERDQQGDPASPPHHFVRRRRPRGLRLPHAGSGAEERQEDGALRRGRTDLPPVLRQRHRGGVDAGHDLPDAPVGAPGPARHESGESADAVGPRDGDRLLAAGGWSNTASR